MDREPGLSVLILRPVAERLRTAGVDPTSFLRDLGVDEQAGAETFVRGSLAGRALTSVAERVGDRSLGLTIARGMPLGSFGMFDHAVWTGGSLRDAIARSSHFYSLVTEGVSLALEHRGMLAHVSMRAPLGARHGTVLTDIALALNVLRAREATGYKLRLRSVSFRHRTADAKPYDALFQTTVAFSQPVDGVVFDASMLDLPVRTPDPAAATRVEARAAKMEHQLQSGDPFLDRVRAAVLRGVWARDQALSRLGRELAMGERTLQRRLREHGTSHREIVDDVRRRLAEQLLVRDDTSILEVAYEVGFARLQAFYRAFGRWTGRTPAAFRSSRRISAPAGARSGRPSRHR